MKREPPWSMFGATLDPVEVRAAIMDILMERKERTTEQFVSELKGRFGATPVMNALRHLRESGYIHRSTNRTPWSLKPRA